MKPSPTLILVIDGDAASRNYLAAVLGKVGYTVLTATLGREGLIAAWKDTPDLIILDPVLPDLTGLELISRLRKDHRTATLPCVALSSRQDSQDMVAMLAAGCNEYLPKSGQSVPHLLELIPRLAKSGSTPRIKNGTLTVFLSAKGGLGTSSLCANLAMCHGSEQTEASVAVMDMVLPVGSLAEIVGIDSPLNLVTASNQKADQTTPEFFKEKLPRIPNWYFHLLAGSPDPASATNLVAERVDVILASILAAFDLVFVDVGRSLSRICLPVIKKADTVVLVVGTDLSSSTQTRTVWDYLKGQGVDPQRLFVLQNRSVGLEGLTKTEFEQMTGLQVRVTIPYMSGNLTIANNRHEPVLQRFPDDSVALTLRDITHQVAELGRQVSVH